MNQTSHKNLTAKESAFHIYKDWQLSELIWQIQMLTKTAFDIIPKKYIIKFEHLFVAVVAVVAAVLLSSCVAPSRIDVNQFKSKLSGRINTKDIPAFRECVVNGFNPLQSLFFSPRLTRQQQLSSVSRIETIYGAWILVSVDMHEDGRVELFETTAQQQSFTSKQPEYDAFNLCLKEYGKP